MLVYHSSDQCFSTPDVGHSREALDFGKGFYVTRLFEQAEKYANRFLRVGSDAYLHIFNYTPDSEMRIKKFDTYIMKNGLISYVAAVREMMYTRNMISLREE